jgi:hypothetical protein
MIAPHALPPSEDRRLDAPRVQHPARVVQRSLIAALTIATVVLGGALYRSTRPAPSNAVGVYSEWVALMDMGLAPNSGAWATRYGIAEGPYAANKSAETMLAGVSLGGNRDTKLRHLTDYLAGINHDLDLMLSSTLSDRSTVALHRDARYVRSTLRNDVLTPLVGRGHTPYVLDRLPTTDAAAEAMSVQVCKAEVAVLVREYARFFSSGPYESRTQMLNDCAQGDPIPY